MHNNKIQEKQQQKKHEGKSEINLFACRCVTKSPKKAQLSPAGLSVKNQFLWIIDKKKYIVVSFPSPL